MALGLGGACGSLVGAYITEYSHPRWAFLIYSFLGLIVMALGAMLDPSVEMEAASDEGKAKPQLLENLKRSASQVRAALRLEEIYRVILFFLLCGVTGPTFGEFWYYFQMNIVEFSKFQYAMMNVLGYASVFFGTLLYNMWLKEMEIRDLLRYAVILSVFSSACSGVFAMRWNLLLGISDTAYIATSDVLMSTLALATTQMPTMVLFAKVTPEHIEATCFAFLTGTSNFCNGVLAPLMGSFINDFFVGVSKEDFSKFHYLCAIGLVSQFAPFFFLHLIPTKQEIKDLQESRENAEAKEK